MTTMPMIDPAMTSSGSAEVEMRARQRQIEENRRNINAGNQKTKEEKLRESCEGFEAMFIQKMWEGMRASLPQDGMMQSRDEKHWQGMYDQELGKSMAKAGGIGLADMMMSQMSRNLQDASEVAAGSSRRRPMDIAPAPLMVEQPAAPKNPAPIVAAQSATQAGAAQSATQAGAAQSATQATTPTKTAEQTKSGMDLYSNASAVAPSPEDPTSENLAVNATNAAPPAQPVNTPPEVQSALTSLATMTAQAEAARGVGQQTVNHINGQQPQIPAQGQAGPAVQTPATSQGTATPQGTGATAYPQGINPATVNAPPPDLPLLTPHQPVYTAPRTASKAPNQDVQHITRTQRQTARPDQTSRASRTASAPELENGAKIATNSISRPTAPFTGQNMPVSPVGDVATELLKSQLGEPSVKTKL